MNAPRQGRGEILQPLPGCASLFPFLPGGSLRSPPAKLPAPLQGAPAYLEKYVTVFMKSWTERQILRLLDSILPRAMATSVHVQVHDHVNVHELRPRIILSVDVDQVVDVHVDVIGLFI